MTAVTTFRLNHKLCSKCLVCRKSCSITYVSHYGVNLRKSDAGSFCRCRAKPCSSCYLLCTCSPALEVQGLQPAFARQLDKQFLPVPAVYFAHPPRGHQVPVAQPDPSGPQHHHLWTCDIHMCLKKSSGCPAPSAPLLSVPAGAACCVIWASPTARTPQHPVQTNRGAAGPTGCLEPPCPLTHPSAPHCVFTSFHCLHMKWAWENGVTVLTQNC